MLKEKTKLVEELIKEFGEDIESIHIKMKDCQDINKFIDKIELVHKKADKSTSDLLWEI